jgi:OHCU decarboxylase
VTDAADYPRDLVGYGRTPPEAKWPGGARIAVQIVINYEEGGENAVLHGDEASEAFLSDIAGATPWPGRRHMNMESLYEYGSRAGFWRLHRLFTSRSLPVTVFGVATALARNPDAVAAMGEAGWEIATHGYKWIDYARVPRAEERDHIRKALALHEQVTGAPPLGFYQGRTSENSLPLIAEETQCLYAADAYADDLPYWQKEGDRALLIVPYALDANDMNFATPTGFTGGTQFFEYLKDSFDVLYAEGAERPRMMSVGLHCRLVGRPGRVAALARFLDHVAAHRDVWVTTRAAIANHWVARHTPAWVTPSVMTKAAFVARFGDIYEHTPEIATAVFQAGLTPAQDTAEGLHAAMRAAAAGLDDSMKRRLILAHPDLAGRLAQAKQLTEDSTREQAGAGLDALTLDERARFTGLNDAYKAKFGIPFIIAVKGRSKADILVQFERRLDHDVDLEWREALLQIDEIARLRLGDRLPA